MRIVMVVLALGGCASKGQWDAHAITELQLGPYKIKIPAGWRDMSELKDPAMRGAVPNTQHWLARQDQPVGKTSPTIQLGWFPGRPKRSCADLDAESKRAGGSDPVVAVSVGGNDGCKVTATRFGFVGRTITAFVDGGSFTMTCIAPPKDLEVVNPPCDDLVAQLHVTDRQETVKPAEDTGHLTETMITDGEAKVRDEVVACGRAGVEVTLHVAVTPRGQPTVTIGRATDGKVAACAADAMRAARFAATAQGGEFDIPYRF